MTESDGPSAPLSKTQFVYEWLKEEILSGSLTPGSRIRQQDVARTLGVSYTPVREAIRQLQATGLITYEPNRATPSTLSATMRSASSIYCAASSKGLVPVSRPRR